MYYVLNFAPPNKHGAEMRFCLCDCGQETIVRASDLCFGRIQSCGCLRGAHKKTRMTRQQKPLRSVYDEIFDVDMPYEKKKVLRETYNEFFDTLDPELACGLRMLLF